MHVGKLGHTRRYLSTHPEGGMRGDGCDLGQYLSGAL